MEGLVREGLVRSIGVSNFGAKKLADILSYATIPPAVCQVLQQPRCSLTFSHDAQVPAFCRHRMRTCFYSYSCFLLQVEVHPYHRNDALIAWCRQHDIHVTAFSPLGSPDSASIFPRKKPLVLMEDDTVKVWCVWCVVGRLVQGD